MVRWENYEEYMMMHADGELNPEEEKALIAFVAEHGLQKELAAYGMVKMTPDTNVVHGDKDGLLRKEKKVIVFPAWQRYSVAAGVAAIVFISLFRYGAADKNSAAVVWVDSNKAQVLPVNNDSAGMQKSGIAQLNDTADTKVIVHTAVAGTGKNAPAIALTKTTAHHAANATLVHKEQATQMPVAANNKINELRPAGVKQISNTPIATAAAAIVVVPALPDAVATDEEQHNMALAITLPIDELRQKGIDNVNAALATGAEKLNALKQEISEASLTIKVEKRKLILLF